MDIGDGPHPVPQQQGIGPGQDGLIDPPGTPLFHSPPPQAPAAGHHHHHPWQHHHPQQATPLPVAPPPAAAGPAVPKISNSNVNKIEEMLDSKKNNWT